MNAGANPKYWYGSDSQGWRWSGSNKLVKPKQSLISSPEQLEGPWVALSSSQSQLSILTKELSLGTEM